VDEDQLLLGGYVAAPRAVRQDWQNAELLPQQLVTVSECLTEADHGPEFYAWHTDRDVSLPCGSALLAVGFQPDDALALIEEVGAAFDPAKNARASGGWPPECLKSLDAGTPMPDDAQLRGFEVIGIEYALSDFHSWLCHSYEADVAVEFGIRPNAWGLIDTYHQATTVLAWMEALPPNRAPEPVYWTVAAVAECVFRQPHIRPSMS
jgi:hypothetical protein